MLRKESDVLKGGSGPGKSGGGLDVIGPCPGNDLTHLHLLILGQKTGLDDHLQDSAAADLLQCADLLLDLVVAFVLQVADVDHHVDLVGAVFQGIFCLKCFDLRGIIAVGEADDRTDSHPVSHILLGPFHKRGGDADRCRAVMDGVVTDLPDFLPHASLQKQSMVYLVKNMFMCHSFPPVFLPCHDGSAVSVPRLRPG